MSVTGVDSVPESHGLVRVFAYQLSRAPAWLVIGAGACLLVVLQGTAMMRDTDTFWQIKIGQWILDHRAMPYSDIYSLTKAGEPWTSSSWLSQVMFAEVYSVAGWTGVVILSSLAIAATFALLVHVLERGLPSLYASFVSVMAFSLCAGHFLARPHILAMPAMVAWVSGLISASDRRVKPSFWLLPLLALWANLHGGFVLGLALVAPIALDALWNAPSSERKPLAIHWTLFGFAALVVCCLTPYGWNSLLASRKILGLGELLSLILEWAPVSFASFSLFEGCILLAIGAALYFGVVLPPLRILLTLGLMHMALNHVRNIEIFALLAPIVLLAPLSKQFGFSFARSSGDDGKWGWFRVSAVAMLAALVLGLLAASRHPRPENEDKYAAAMDVLRQHKATRVFNDYGFGGYMIWAGMSPFIDGRAEVYGETFTLDHFQATSLKNPDMLFRLLDTNRIDATILYPDTPAARLLDHIDGWTRVLTSDLAIVHVRTRPPGDGGFQVKAN